MSNKSQANVRKSADVDPRVMRTTHALGSALAALLQERAFEGITVQDILDRAGVGRTTFYTHYRNKEDVLHSSYERLFSMLERSLDRPSPVGPRLFPVTEFLEHVRETGGVMASLRSSGQLREILDQTAGHAARIIERRVQSPRSGPYSIPRALVARMLAGALMEALLWWIDHPSLSTPARMDADFHAVAWGALHRLRMS